MTSFMVAKAMARFNVRNLALCRQFGALADKSYGLGSIPTRDVPWLAFGAQGRTKVDSALLDESLENLFSRRVPLPYSFPRNSSAKNLEISLNASSQEDLSIEEPEEFHSEVLHTMARNTRRPKKANKGARPCSRASRRRKKEQIGKRKR
jgi:hypothetical protein